MNEDKTTRHRRLQRRLHLVQTASLAVWLVALAAWPVLLPVVGRAPLNDLLVLGVAVVTMACISAPWAWMREVRLERRFGRHQTTTREWMGRHAWQWGMTLASVLPVWLLFQLLQRESPWLVVPVTLGAAITGSLVLLAVAPWLVTWSPRVTPIADEALAGRLHALIGRAGLRVAGMHAWREGRIATEPNAALLGAGPGRRLLLSEALLTVYDPEEIEIVVAHELGHHARGHIWRRVRVTWVVGAVALAAAQAMALLRAWATGADLADPRALPWVLLAAGAVALVTRPRMLAQSRAHEIESDDFAIEVTGRPDVLERVLVRLGAHYRAAPDPSPFESAFFLTHPPVRERVTRARNWQQTVVARTAAFE